MLAWAADEAKNGVADELGGRDFEGLRSGLGLFPLGIGEADAAILADYPRLLCLAVGGFGVG